jgi:hypothetical protein
VVGAATDIASSRLAPIGQSLIICSFIMVVFSTFELLVLIAGPRLRDMRWFEMLR